MDRQLQKMEEGQFERCNDGRLDGQLKVRKDNWMDGGIVGDMDWGDGKTVGRMQWQ